MVLQHARKHMLRVVENGSPRMWGRTPAVSSLRASAVSRSWSSRTPCREQERAVITRGFAAAPASSGGDVTAPKSPPGRDGTPTPTAAESDVSADLSTSSTATSTAKPTAAAGDFENEKETQDETKTEKPSELASSDKEEETDARLMEKFRDFIESRRVKQNGEKVNDEKQRESWRKWFAGNVVAIVAALMSSGTLLYLFQSETSRNLNKHDDVLRKNVDTAVARLCEPLVFEEMGDLPEQLERVENSGAPFKVKKKAMDYLTLGIEPPSELELILSSGGKHLFRPTAVEGLAGEGKTTQIHRTLNALDASGVLFVTCKENAKIWQCIAEALKLTGVKEEDVRRILMEALRKYKRETGKIPTIIVDDMHHALEKDNENTEAFLSNCSAAFDQGTFNSVFLGGGRVAEKIDDLNVPGLRARLEKADFVSHDPEKIGEPLAAFLSVIFGENPKNDAALITPDALRPLANDLLTLLGLRYLDLQELHVATSPADAKRIVVDLIEEETSTTWRNVAEDSICRANFLSIVFAKNTANAKAEITPAALRPLVEDVLTLLGPRYWDLRKLHDATSPADAKRIVVDLIEKETATTWRNVGEGSICRALVESDAGMFIDTKGTYDGDEPLKCLDGDGKPSDLEKAQLVRKDKAKDEKQNMKTRFRPHHGAAFV
eukprot:CAMPEP_0118920052 /NCGR_PEP_ID=MMETSP1166-20130328/18873_1 /TAXON_ID=1104430 /ORGANISM="Chrysoreinhardia sp, Strain CCMP3193" /LENGTH=663 /DNA_ID=CAMNT_0006860589 /DNA_START=124 /DNA_END=2111 /DNA_ORIENTATION=+